MRRGERPGYPRYKPRTRYRTIEVAQVNPAMLRVAPDGGRASVRIKGLPAVELRLNRTLPDPCRLRSLRLLFRAGKLYVDLVYEVGVEPLPSGGRTTGIDMGVHARVALSDGTVVAGLTPDRRRERRLRRQIARSRRGSTRRARRVAALGRETNRNRVARRNETHRLTTQVVHCYDRIAVEALSVAKMTRSARGTAEEPGTNVAQKRGLNRRILDQSLGLVRSQLTYKAAWAGRELVAVDPRHTSQECSRCGTRSEQREYRVYRCTSCGMELDRDVNAARNIEERAFGEGTWRANGAGDSPRSAQPAPVGALEIVA